MCFSPQVSIATAIIEFVFAGIILLKFKKSVTRNFMPVFLFLLGFYQFTEFMLCTTNNVFLWGKLGFITYTFLPVVALHFVVYITKFTRSKKIMSYLYFPPIVYAVIAMFSKGFIQSGYCHTVFVTVSNVLFNERSIGFFIYFTYYAGYIFSACIIMARQYRREKSQIRKKLYFMGTMGMLTITLSAVLFIIILPAYNAMFPSVYCEFALMFAIMALIASYVDDKYSLS